MELPTFRYFRDPYADDGGVFDESDEPCECCGRTTGYQYLYFMYAEDEIEVICPWCIADGSAAERFDGTFVDDVNIPDDAISAEHREELTKRTPSHFAYQEAKWLVHCGEPAVYAGVAGYDELVTYGESAMQSIMDDLPDSMSPDDKLGFVKDLHRDGSCIAHVFECLHCKTIVAYGECD
jgi:uncharacterized protein CbrC (UPF0167 family)